LVIATTRYLVPELMDDPALDPAEHVKALRGLQRINVFSRTAQTVAEPICRWADMRELADIRILDVGCGSGDVAMKVARLVSSRRGRKCTVVGWDISPTAIELARSLASVRENPAGVRCRVEFETRDILEDSETCDPAERFDFVYCSLFLHHFCEDEAVRILRSMKERARYGLIVDDLLRSAFGLGLAHLAVRALSTSRIVRFDGPQSVRAAFNVDEMRSLADEAGLEHVHIRRRWPVRFTMTWSRKHGV
jgi:SAM-dependent methyltransferase